MGKVNQLWQDHIQVVLEQFMQGAIAEHETRERLTALGLDQDRIADEIYAVYDYLEHPE